jgi:signal transduction histidine kinase
VPEPASALVALELLELILSASDLSGGLSLAVQRLLKPRGFSRVAALAEQRGSFRVLASAGFETDSFPGISVPDEAHPLAAALRSSEPFVRVPGPAGVGGLARCVVFPVRTAEGRGAMAFVAEHDAGSCEGDAEIEEVAEGVRQIGPGLCAQWERERLRARVAERDRRIETFRAIADALPDPILITDARQRIVMENRRARELFATQGGDGDERRRFVETNHHLFSSFLAKPPKESAAALTLVEASTGADLRFQVMAAPLPAAVADAGAVVWMLRDVTALSRAGHELQHQFRKARRAEARSRRERDRLDLILANVGAPIVVTDERAEVILMNREAERLFEAPEGAEAESPVRLGAAANESRFARVVGDFTTGGDTAGIAKLDLTDPGSGEDFPVEIVSGRIRDERGDTTAVVSIFHDKSGEVENARLATELGELNAGLEERVREATRELEARNRELEWQRRELERAYRLKSEFLASMSHELRTPINALLGYTSLMRDRIYGDLTPRQEESLDRMRTASEHLLELVNDVLDLAKIEAGRMPIHVEPVDAGEVLRELAAAVDPLVRRKELSFALEVPPGLPVLHTDRTRVKQVLLNLLSNAIKFTQRGGLRVTARGVDGGVEIAVADTGIGIAPHDLDAIWEDFRQVDQSSTREYGGTGLGLSIVRKLLGLLGGSVRVESEAGKGSVFTVSFPLESRPLPLGEEAARAANLAALRPVPAEAPPEASEPSSSASQRDWTHAESAESTEEPHSGSSDSVDSA